MDYMKFMGHVNSARRRDKINKDEVLCGYGDPIMPGDVINVYWVWDQPIDLPVRCDMERAEVVHFDEEHDWIMLMQNGVHSTMGFKHRRFELVERD